MNVKMLFPHFKRKCLIMSFDDNPIEDKMIIEKFNELGIIGTFHINSGFIGDDGKVSSDDFFDVYDGHEVSIHSVSHPFLESLTLMDAVGEVLKDKENLESYLLEPVRGMSYPFGTYDFKLTEMLQSIGIDYSRTVKDHLNFSLPDHLLTWHPTMHMFHGCDESSMTVDKFEVYTDKFLKADDVSLFYVWGHTWEFKDHPGRLAHFLEVIQKLGNNELIHYTKNIDLADYINAFRMLKYSTNKKIIENLSCFDIYLEIDGVEYEISSGSLLRIKDA